MTIDLINVRDDDPAIFNTIRQVVANQSVYAPGVPLALCMSPYLYRRLKEAFPMDTGTPLQLYELPVYLFMTLPPEDFLIVREDVAQALAKAEPELIRQLFDGPPRASAPTEEVEA